LGAKPKQTVKKEGGWGEGIFARLLPFPFRLRKEKAEGGFGGNSTFSLRNQIADSPAACLNTWKAVAGLASLLGVLLKKSSNINQKTPPRTRQTNSPTLSPLLMSSGLTIG